MRVAVIGGGITGLVATYELVKRGLRPILIEPGQIGGMVRSVSQGGFTLELGPNVLVERPDLMTIVRELDLTSRLRYPVVKHYGQYVWWQGGARKVPAGFKEFLKSPLFSLGTKAMLPLRVLTPGLLTPSREDLSVLDFFKPLIGESSARGVLDPVLKGIYGGDVGELSARTIFPGLWSAAVEGSSIVGYMRRRPRGPKPSIMVVEGGIQTVTNALEERLRGRIDHVGSRVERVGRLSSGEWSLSLADGSEFTVDGCIATIAGGALGAILRGVDEGLAKRAASVQYASLGVVHLSVPRSESLIKDAFGVLFPGGMQDNLLGVMFNSLIFPHVAPPDRHILTVMVGGAQARENSFDSVGLRERIPKLISQLLGVSLPAWISFTEWRGAIPQLKVGHHGVVSELNSFESKHPGLVLAGVDRGGVGISDRVRMAGEAVQRVCKLAS